MHNARIAVLLAIVGLCGSAPLHAEPLTLTGGFQLVNGGRWYQFDAPPRKFITYEINPAASAPVPEPATLVLIGTGLLGIARIARLRPKKPKT